jgi:hypothetical protein
MGNKKSKPVTEKSFIKGGPKFGRYKVSAKEDRTYDAIVFDSKWEMNTYKLLKSLLPDAHIHRQVEFLLQPKFRSADGKAVREINYASDFVITRDGNLLPDVVPPGALVLDSKGHVTDIFKLKNKLFMYKYGTVIHQVKKASDLIPIVDKFKAMQ